MFHRKKAVEKVESAQIPAPDPKIGETRARVEEVFWMVASIKLRMIKIEALLEHILNDAELRRLIERLGESLEEGGKPENGSE